METARGDDGPDLHDLHTSDARIHKVITAGIKGEMPSFGKKLGDPDVVQVNEQTLTDNEYSIVRRPSSEKRSRRARTSETSNRTRSTWQTGASFRRTSSLYARISGRSTSIHCREPGRFMR